jgi:hypothetical protein
VVKRSLIAVVLFFTLVAGVLVAAQAPAAAAGGPVGCRTTVVVNNGHGRLEVEACVNNVGLPSPGEQMLVTYECFRSGTTNHQPCNIGATQDLWYNATRVQSRDVSGCCWQDGFWGYVRSGPLAACTTAQIKVVVRNIQVRFSDNSLWPGSTAQSAVVAGSSNPACLA